MTLKFKSMHQDLLMERGKLYDNEMRVWIRDSLGLTGKKVEATHHSILSGPPGVGKTYGTTDECNKGNVKHVVIPPGASDVDVTMKLAAGVYTLQPNEKLVVILDDADDVLFNEYPRFNRWKIALGDVDYDQGIIPTWNHPVKMTSTMDTLRKENKTLLYDALTHFTEENSLGVTIPTDRVRFVVLCNLDLEDPKAFSRNTKMRSAMAAIMDRFNYTRINLDWENQWGWLAYALSTSQPFPNFPLEDWQKIELLQWMHSNWDKLRSTSFRTVRKLAATMINNPNNYVDFWNKEKRGN